MKIGKVLGVAAAAALLAACQVEVEDKNKDGVPEDVDVRADSVNLDLPDVDVTTDTQSINVPVPDIEVNADSDSAR